MFKCVKKYKYILLKNSMYLLDPHWEIVKEYMGIYKFNTKFAYIEKNLSYILKHIIFEGQDEFYECIVYGYEYGIIDDKYITDLEKSHSFFKREYIPIWYKPLYYSNDEYLKLITKIFWEKIYSDENKKYYLDMFSIYSKDMTLIEPIY